MKRLVSTLTALLAIAMISGCKPKIVAVEINVQLMYQDAPFAVEGILVSLSDAAGTATFSGYSDAAGVAKFTVNPGNYMASSTYRVMENDKYVVYNGSNSTILVGEGIPGNFTLPLSKVSSQPLIIKELYFGGCPKDDGSGAFSDDAYFIIYNNTPFEVDASDLVIGSLNPYNGHSNNKFYGTDNKLIYESDNWLPAGGSMWYFTQPVKIPGYSQIVVAVFGAIDHRVTVKASVNLANPDYYWMSNSDIPAYTNKKYVVSDLIPTSHYLSGFQINKANAWTLSNNSPAFFIGMMPKAQLEPLCKNTANFDLTGGNDDRGWSVKFPKANVLGAIEVFKSDKIETSKLRFSSDINTGYVVLANQLGYTIYRNVDKEATEALPENEGKLVYNYAGGTQDVEGTTDPSGIDAEASIAAGAHIVYLQTNDSGKDFHQRKVASLKK
ncbi:MAG: DUF4876 domain-containing protein [Bacteroidales bacterium]|nr:DUF4876 domain-containing protein [Bacteroidales bacterium]